MYKADDSREWEEAWLRTRDHLLGWFEDQREELIVQEYGQERYDQAVAAVDGDEHAQELEVESYAEICREIRDSYQAESRVHCSPADFREPSDW